MPQEFSHTNGGFRDLQIRISQDDQPAFTLLYAHFGRKLIHFAVGLVRLREVAEELVEDVFVNVWANRAKIAGIDNIAVYLYVAVKNRALTSLSRKARELVTAPFDYLDTDTDDFASDPYDLLITAEMMDRMNLAIQTLPPRCKMIFKLVREDGLRYKEVSEILNISVNTIDAQMAIAVRKICLALRIDQAKSRHEPLFQLSHERKAKKS